MKSLLCLMFLLSCSFAGPAFADPRPARNLQNEINVNGENRRYLVQVPHNYSPEAPVPLLLAFHASGGSAGEFQRTTRFNNLAAESGFIVVYPQARKDYWNDGRAPANPNRPAPDDVRFVSELVSSLRKEYSIDTRRIYAVGMSNGGTLVLRLACELPGMFAGFATVAASFPRHLATVCEPTKPISVLIVHGTADPVIPWQGGDVNTSSSTHGLFLPIEETAKFWARRGSCRETAQRRRVSGADIKNAHFVEEFRYDSCRQGIEVILNAIVGGDHSWPEPKVSALAELIIKRGTGLKAESLGASRMIWNFLSRQRLVP